MACFTQLKAPGRLINLSDKVALFSDGKVETPVFYNAGSYNFSWVTSLFKEVEGLDLISFQEFLEHRNGSILVPLTETKDNYVYIKGQRDRQGEEIH